MWESFVGHLFGLDGKRIRIRIRKWNKRKQKKWIESKLLELD